MSKLTSGLRWVSVLPGAGLFVLVVMFPIHWVVISMAGENFATLEPFANAFFTPLCFIFAGAWIAPRFKRQTAIIMTVVMASVTITATAYVIATKEIIWGKFVITIALQIAGIISGLICARKKALSNG